MFPFVLRYNFCFFAKRSNVEIEIKKHLRLNICPRVSITVRLYDYFMYNIKHNKELFQQCNSFILCFVIFSLTKELNSVYQGCF